MTSEIVILAVLLGLIPAFIARHRGGPFVFFWFIGALLFPVGLVLALIAKDGRKRCPSCDETVSAAAVVCPHCQRDIPALAAG